jgi:hypothetical protein
VVAKNIINIYPFPPPPSCGRQENFRCDLILPVSVREKKLELPLNFLVFTSLIIPILLYINSSISCYVFLLLTSDTNSCSKDKHLYQCCQCFYGIDGDVAMQLLRFRGFFKPCYQLTYRNSTDTDVGDTFSLTFQNVGMNLYRYGLKISTFPDCCYPILMPM